MKKRESAVELTNLCVVYNKDKILLQEKICEDHKGIIFPGGHVEGLESFEESIIREVKEETGLTILNPILCGIKDFIRKDGSRYIVLLYKATEFTGSLCDSNEGHVFWENKSRLSELDIMWDTEEILEIVESDLKYELFYFDK